MQHFIVNKPILIFWSPLLIFLIFACEQQQDKPADSFSSDGEEKKEKVSIAEIEKGIKDHIDAVTKENDGFFPIKNDSFDLNMRLVRVHTEYLSNLGPGKYFACVDLADQGGDVYDVDFFLEGKPGDMRVTRTSVHKLNGKPFYAWKQNKADKTWFQVPFEGANSALLGIVEQSDEFEFYYEVILPEIEKETEIWIPRAQNDLYQTIDVIETSFPVKESLLHDDEYGNQAFYMKLSKEQSNQRIFISYKVSRKEKAPYPSVADEDLSAYLMPNTLIPVGDKFKNIALEAIGDKTTDETLIQARALYDHVIDNMKYIKDGNHGTGDAVYACDAQSGNCSEFHSYFIALARSIGIPARFAIGAAIPSDRDEGGVDGYHCWAEFHAEGKWWPVDISEANKYTALSTYYFGHHPANRIEFSKGRDIVFEPLPETGAINFFAYPIMEEGGLVIRPEVKFSFKRIEKTNP
jgi:hypothetical protein